MSTKMAVLLSGLLAIATGAHAASEDIYAANNLVLMQFSSTLVDYREYGNGFLGTPTGLLDQESGPVPGVALAASGMAKENYFYWQASYGYSSGGTDYTGALMGGTFGSYVGVSGAVLVDLGARIGRGLAFRDAFMLTPYLELGSHEWERGVNYGEIYNHHYYGLGLMGQYSPVDRFVLSVNALYGRTFGAHIFVNSGPLANGFSGALGNSPLSRLGAAADYAFTRQLHGNVAVEYTRFRYGMSAAYPVGGNNVAWEPESTTHYMLFKVGLGAAF
jgi:hypothetical protein